MSGKRFKSIRLRNGEEIISEIIAVSKDKVTLFRPALIRTVAVPDPSRGIMREFTLFKEWLPTEENEVSIHNDYIMTSFTPRVPVMKSYLEFLERQDVAKDIAKDLMNDPDALQDFLSTTISEQLEEELPTDKEDKHPAMDDISMNFVMNPKMFMEFLAHGIMSLNEDEDGNQGVDLDPDAFMETYDEMKRHEEETRENPPPHRAKKKRGEWDFGNQFDDWDPTPD
tara:strand:+ start:989 stop:1666 length:678 start_codon:yes stop_codon:yes gene_type:complete